MTSLTTEPSTLRSILSIAVTSAAAAGVAASHRRSYSCYNCNHSFHITPTATTSSSSPSSFRCPQCHHRHLIPHHTISPPSPPAAPSVLPPRSPGYAPASSSFNYQTSDDSDSDDDDDYDSDNSLLSSTTSDFHPSTPASKSVVDSLPIKFFPPNSILSLQSCLICMEDFEVNSGSFVTVNELPCAHYFHKDCIVEWLRRSNTCPLCRYLLPVDPTPEERIDPGFNHREMAYNAFLVVDLDMTRGPLGGRVNREESLSSNANAVASGSDGGAWNMFSGEISSWVFDEMRDEDGDTLMVDA